jgi:hypothetical protein
MPRKSKDYPNLDAFREQMGKVPDHEIARMAGTSVSIVGRYRRRYGLGVYEGYKFGSSNPAGEVVEAVEPEAVEPEVEAPAEAAVESTGPRKAGRRSSKLDPFAAMLGMVPDSELAIMAGVTAENVRAFRRRHNIPAQWREESAAAAEVEAPAPAPVVEAPAPAPAAVAAPAPAAVEAPAPPPVAAPAPAPAPAVAVLTLLSGYAVRLDGSSTELLVIAADIAQAAERAAAGLGGDARHLVGIRYIGPAVG